MIHLKSVLILASLLFFVNTSVFANKSHKSSKKGNCIGAGPQAPRDISLLKGVNSSRWNKAKSYEKMNLCNIHFHRSAEHKGSGYPFLVGEGEHKGYACSKQTVKKSHSKNHHGKGKSCGGINLGDTVEVHWVFTSCNVKPGPTLASCLNPNCANPELRVEARVFTLTEGQAGELDFSNFRVSKNQPKNKLPKKGLNVEYLGSTTGPKYNNHKCSPYQVTWSVSPSCLTLKKSSLDHWCSKNIFKENHAHGVRELVTSKSLLSQIVQ